MRIVTVSDKKTAAGREASPGETLESIKAYLARAREAGEALEKGRAAIHEMEARESNAKAKALLKG